MNMKIFSTCLLSMLFFSSSFSQSQKLLSSGEIQLALNKLNTVGTILYIAAHPDDENTRLLTWFANEKKLRTGYLSITRGDGGQNLIGKEQGESLGLIRTHELLAARSIDGAEQFFTRANDFGYSKNPEETFNKWNHDSILADVVWVIRKFRPDLIITRFPVTGEGGHGHHTASAILASEAFKISGNPDAFPEQMKYVQPWKAKSLWWNVFSSSNLNTTQESLVKTDVGIFNSLLGCWYGELAAQSRSQHKSQGFGVARNRGKQIENFKAMDGDTSCGNLFCTIDFSWNRIKGAGNFSALMDTIIKKYDATQPVKSLPGLINAREVLKSIQDDYWKNQKLAEIERLIFSCASLWVEAVSTFSSVVADDSLKIKLQFLKAGDVPVFIQRLIFPGGIDTLFQQQLSTNETLTIEKSIKLSKQTNLSNPYWLSSPHEEGLYHDQGYEVRGKPINDPEFTVQAFLTLFDHAISVTVPIQYKWTDPIEGEKYKPVESRPVVLINFRDETILVTDKNPVKVKVVLKSEREGIKGKLHFSTGEPFIISPSELPVTTGKKGDEQIVELNIRLNTFLNRPQINVLSAEFVSDDLQFRSNRGLNEIKYSHIPNLTWFPESKIKIVGLDLQRKGKRIGYIEGAGDAVPECLRQAGYEVEMINDEMLEEKSLSVYDAVIIGVRAFNTNARLPYSQKKLMQYVQDGGCLIVQYNTNNFISSAPESIGPYPFKISRDRVTDERAEIRFEKPLHPLLNYPNKISAADFDGWVQERGLYFPSDADKRYETVISCNDPGEKPLNNSILTCKYGKGVFIYTSLSFFRQLPAGVPGAYRLFANLVAAGK